jgi:copper chaperone
MTTQIFTVTGMTCGHCAQSVTEELSELPGVTDVQVTLETGHVAVTAERQVSKDAATAAVTEAGYSLSGWPEAG